MVTGAPFLSATRYCRYVRLQIYKKSKSRRDGTSIFGATRSRTGGRGRGGVDPDWRPAHRDVRYLTYVVYVSFSWLSGYLHISPYVGDYLFWWGSGGCPKHRAESRSVVVIQRHNRQHESHRWSWPNLGSPVQYVHLHSLSLFAAGKVSRGRSGAAFLQVHVNLCRPRNENSGRNVMRA